MLTEKLTYQGSVIGIHEAADSFDRKHGGTGKMYCHLIQIGVHALSDEVLTMQMCTERPTVTEFQINDDIKFQTTKFTSGTWSFKFIEKVVGKPRLTKQPVYEPAPFHDVVRNPVVGGTAIDRAASSAAHFLQMQGNATDERLLNLTKKLYDLFIQHSPQ